MIGYSNSLGVYLLNPYIYGTGTSYLLDTYSAAAAYSLRQLKTGVTNVVRVRRSGDNAESDFTATEITDGTLTTWTGANDGFVVTLYDQVGSSNVTQSTAANQPKLVSSGVLLVDGNGNPKATFDGTNDYVTTASGFMSNTETDIWCFNVSPSDELGIVKDPGGATWGWRLQSATGPNWDTCEVIQGATLQGNNSTPITSASKLLVGQYKRASNVTLWINGSQVANDISVLNIDLRTATGLIEMGRDAGKTALLMDFQETIFFYTDESANRTSIESDINTHYSIY